MAEQAPADVQYALALLYLDKDAAHDPAKAFQWLKSAADQGHADAWNRLGKCYIEGWGTGRDFTQAMTCYRKAARLGSAAAHYHIGLMYLEGELIAQNEAAGYKWLEKAAALGDADADVLLLEKYQADKGKLAEYLVHKQLLALARQDPATYRYFDEVVFLEKDGENSSETDHVMVCPAGIIVIETKNWGGIIHGRKEDRNWAAEMARGQMRPHLNPLQQNQEHVAIFKRKLGGHQPIDSLIVFYKPKFGNEMPDNVISLDALPDYFNGQPTRLSAQQVEAIAGRIEALRAKGPEAKEEHVRRLKIRQQKRAQRLEEKWREIDDGKVS